MLINLKISALNSEAQHIDVEIMDRLPDFIEQPFLAHCDFTVQSSDDYYLLKLTVNSELTIVCQRCLQRFSHDYTNTTELAFFNSDELAETYINNYECIVIEEPQVDLIDLVTDEIHLYCPEMHLDHRDCDREVDQFIRSDH